MSIGVLAVLEVFSFSTMPFNARNIRLGFYTQWDLLRHRICGRNLKLIGRMVFELRHAINKTSSDFFGSTFFSNSVFMFLQIVYIK